MSPESNVYKPPASDVVAGSAAAASAGRSRKPALIAFFLSPVITAALFCSTFVLFDDPQVFDFGMLLGIFVYASLLIYVVVLIFGLPLHWLLGKINRRKWIIYFLVGAVIPSPLVVLFEVADEITGWLALSGTGALCASIFWLLWFVSSRIQARHRA